MTMDSVMRGTDPAPRYSVVMLSERDEWVIHDDRRVLLLTREHGIFHDPDDAERVAANMNAAEARA